jgi:hypothetical protein
MHAEYLISGGIGDHLDEARRVAQRTRAAVAMNGKEPIR